MDPYELGYLDLVEYLAGLPEEQRDEFDWKLKVKMEIEKFNGNAKRLFRTSARKDYIIYAQILLQDYFYDVGYFPLSDTVGTHNLTILKIILDRPEITRLHLQKALTTACFHNYFDIVLILFGKMILDPYVRIGYEQSALGNATFTMAKITPKSSNPGDLIRFLLSHNRMEAPHTDKDVDWDTLPDLLSKAIAHGTAIGLRVLLDYDSMLVPNHLQCFQNLIENTRGMVSLLENGKNIEKLRRELSDNLLRIRIVLNEERLSNLPTSFEIESMVELLEYEADM